MNFSTLLPVRPRFLRDLLDAPARGPMGSRLERNWATAACVAAIVLSAGLAVAIR